MENNLAQTITLFVTSTMATTLVGTIPIVAIVYFLMRRLMREFIENRERSRYDEVKHEAVLSELRASYEHKIADLNREMVATRARWEDANHLLLSGQRNQVIGIPSQAVDAKNFLKPYGIDPNKSQADLNKIFVLTPFSHDERAVFETIKSVCSEAGFTVLRGDEHRAEGEILGQVIEGIVSSGVVIANISSRNPNVFFELGIAMALGKPTLLVSDTLSDVPFDLQSRRIIVFKTQSDLRDKLATALLQTIRASRS